MKSFPSKVAPFDNDDLHVCSVHFTSLSTLCKSFQEDNEVPYSHKLDFASSRIPTVFYSNLMIQIQEH